MAPSPNSAKQNKAGITPIILGGGIGTLIVVCAQAISPPNEISKWLIYSAPALTIASEKLLRFILKEAYRSYLLRKANVASNKIEELLANPHTSSEHKDNLRRRLEEVQNNSVSLVTEQILNQPSLGQSVDSLLANERS